MEHHDIPKAVENAYAFVWAQCDGRERLLIKEMVRNGLTYCMEMTKQDSENIGMIWELAATRTNTLIMVAVMHLNGTRIIPELSTTPGFKEADEKGIDQKALHAELLRMLSRVGKMQETLRTMLSEVSDYGATLALLEVHTRPAK